MKIKALILLTSLFLLFQSSWASTFRTNVLAGYQGGFSVRTGFGFENFAEGFPLGFDAGLSFSTVAPGDPYAARQIFINDATNGTPEKSGTIWDFRLDFLYPIKIGKTKLKIVAGPRYSLFEAYFRYIGANEAFSITSQQWGMGLGLKGDFPINRRLSLLVLAGVDYYLPGALHGHDTVYYPDNQNVNPRLDFDYNDAAAAIYAPSVQPNIMIGVSF